MPEMKKIFILCEKGLEVLMPTVKSAVDDMMSCFPQHKADYPVEVIGNWQSEGAVRQNSAGQIVYKPYESVDWYLMRARQKAMMEGRWPQRGQISIDQLCADLHSDPYRTQIPQWSVLITKQDLYGTLSNGQKLNFCLGVSHENEHSIISTARFVDRNGILDTEEFKTVVMHEFGHLIGVTREGRVHSNEQLGAHCTNEGCLMQQRLDGDYKELTRARLLRESRGQTPICGDCITEGNKFFNRQRMAYNITHGLGFNTGLDGNYGTTR
ncbi:MAG: hypothetical protein J6N49_03025 [Alphaproteobacteria bacterium]|nr:hypothetical protein [Alphaproteobacteria bacterium]